MKLQLPYYLFKSQILSRVLQFSVFAFILFGIKLWLIDKYGNQTPFWDQWDGEAMLLYKPYLSGTLHFSDLLAGHSEHRIFTTRVLALALLNINKTWNPILQMTINAVVHVFTLGVGISLLSKITGKNYLPTLIFFSVILFGIPFSWENTLAGFQAQFYFVTLFSILALWMIQVKEPLSTGWWVGVGCAVLAFFSLASGTFAFGATAFTGLVIFFTNLRRTPRQLAAVSILSALFLICIKFTPENAGHAVFKAASFAQFYNAMTGAMAWPIGSSGLIAALLRNLPSLIFVVMMFKNPPKPNDARWFLFALLTWSVGQAVSLAYGRATVLLSSRYIDLFYITILVNLVCLLLIIQPVLRKYGDRSVLVAIFWCVVLIGSLFRKADKTLRDDLASKRDMSKIEELNTRNYLQSGDANYIINKPLLQIPYPDADRLVLILSSPEVRKILPSAISPGISPTEVLQDSLNGFIKNGYYPATPPMVGASWGSYTSAGDAATGTITLNYIEPQAGHIFIPIAGYPLRDSIEFSVEQDGRTVPFTLQENPKESWAYADAKINKGPFSIRLADESKTTWLAVGNPLPAGRFDHLTNIVVSHYYMFLGAGLVVLFLLVVLNSFERNENK